MSTRSPSFSTNVSLLKGINDNYDNISIVADNLTAISEFVTAKESMESSIANIETLIAALDYYTTTEVDTGFVSKTGDTGALQTPTGNTAARPGTPAKGMLRYNETTSSFEGYDGTTWNAISGAVSGDDTIVVETPTLENSWVNSSFGRTDVGYYKKGGRVYLQGSVQSGTNHQTAFTLPSWYRPSGFSTFLAATNTTPATINIEPGGTVRVSTDGASLWVALDGISFVATEGFTLAVG